MRWRNPPAYRGRRSQIEPGRRGVLSRPRSLCPVARLAAGAAPPVAREPPADEDARHRRRLTIFPHDFEGTRRGATIPAGPAFRIGATTCPPTRAWSVLSANGWIGWRRPRSTGSSVGPRSTSLPRPRHPGPRSGCQSPRGSKTVGSACKRPAHTIRSTGNATKRRAHRRRGPRGTRSSIAPSTELADSRVISMPSTEHWNLLTNRSLAYNEAFTRGGMFLTFLSMSFVGLALLAQATGFSGGFLTVDASSSRSTSWSASRRTAASWARTWMTCAPSTPWRASGTPTSGSHRASGRSYESVHDDMQAVTAVYGTAADTLLGSILYGLMTSAASSLRSCRCSLGSSRGSWRSSWA